MRPIVIQQRRLLAAEQELLAAAEEITSVVDRVEPPAADYPWHRLVEEGVRVLLEDTRLMARKCTRVAGALHDSVADFDELDDYVAITAQLDQVTPHGAPVQVGNIGRPQVGPS